MEKRGPTVNMGNHVTIIKFYHDRNLSKISHILIYNELHQWSLEWSNRSIKVARKLPKQEVKARLERWWTETCQTFIRSLYSPINVPTQTMCRSMVDRGSPYRISRKPCQYVQPKLRTGLYQNLFSKISKWMVLWHFPRVQMLDNYFSS